MCKPPSCSGASEIHPVEKHELRDQEFGVQMYRQTFGALSDEFCNCSATFRRGAYPVLRAEVPLPGRQQGRPLSVFPADLNIKDIAMRSLASALLLFPTTALAHDATMVHLHPHGIQYGWVIAAAVCLVGGCAVAAALAPRKGPGR